jgi:inorganic pyrophosphatase
MMESTTRRVGERPIEETPAIPWAEQIPYGSGEKAAAAEGEGSHVDKVTFEVRIELPAGLYNRYSYDQQSEALRLEAVVKPERELPANCAALVGTLGADGRSMAVLVVGSCPIPPDTLLDARLLGGIESPTGEKVVVAVPEADPSCSKIRSVSELPEQQRTELARLAAEFAGTQGGNGLARWFGPDEAVELAREGRRARRLAEAANRRLDRSAGWQVLDPVLRRAGRYRENAAYTEAEFSLSDLPARFQQHVADCLLPDERILHFISRPRMTVEGRFSLFRSRQLNEGVLVATDRQLLVMTDALPPDATLVDWGYLAVAAPVERIESVNLVPTGTTVRLEVKVGAHQGTETLSMEFDQSSLEACRHMAGILARFVPAPECRAVRRIYEVKPADVDLTEAVKLAGEEPMARLEALAERLLPEGEESLARALAPAVKGRKRETRLLLVGRKQIFLLEDSGGNAAEVGRWPIEMVASAELRYSILGSRLRLTAPKGEQREQLTLDSESPGAFGPMLQTFRVLLPLLSNPPQ